MNAAQYGVPQKRERVFIVGIRNDLTDIPFCFPDPVIANPADYQPLSVALEPDVEARYFFSEQAVQGMMRARATMNKGRAQPDDQPCNTVGAHLAKVTLNSTDPVYLDQGRYRRFTSREVARIQSFPDTFTLPGSQTAQYRALGNAIPPVLFWYLADQVQTFFYTLHTTRPYTGQLTLPLTP